MKWIFNFCFLLWSITACAQAPVSNTNREVVFKNVNVVPMDKEGVLPNRVVVVKGGRITAVGTVGATKYSKEALVIDGTGKYLMPGLAEMHAHVPPVADLQPMKEVLLLFAANGVTTIRGMLGHPQHLVLKKGLQSGEILGPRFYTSGPSFNGQTVSSPEVGATMVRQQKAAGYDFLKLHPGLTREKFDAVAKAAKEVGIPFAGHVSYDVGVWRAIEAGYATIDHMDGFVENLVPDIANIPEQQTGLFGMFLADKADTAKIQPLMEGLKRGGIWVVPTQALAERWFAPDKSPEALGAEAEMKYMAPATLNNWINTKKNLMANPAWDPAAITRYITLRKKLIAACNKNGVGLLLGSDAPQVFDVPGFSIHHELRYMVDAGLTPYEALRTGTVQVGRFYNNSDMGVIKKGALADLVLLSANPLTDIENTKRIEGVMLGNNWLSKAWIDSTLKSLEKK